MECKIIAVDALTDSIARIILQANLHGMKYHAGQYVNICQESDVVSPLSIACAPNSHGLLEFHLYHSAKNKKSLALLQKAQDEKIWQLSGPFGDNTDVRLDMTKPIIFLAYGTGFAPIKAVLEAILPEQHPTVSLYWCHDVYMHELLLRWREQDSKFMFHLVDEKKVLAEIVSAHPDMRDYQVYAVGSRAFVQKAYDEFAKHGLIKERFFSDLS